MLAFSCAVRRHTAELAMNSSDVSTRRLLALLLAVSCTAATAADPLANPASAVPEIAADAVAASDLRNWAARGGSIGLRVNADLLRQFGATHLVNARRPRFGHASAACGSS